MATSSSPQVWVFPPVEPPPPSTSTANFGPVNAGDKIKLEWTPAGQAPPIYMYCGADDQYVVSEGNTSPYIYTFVPNVENSGTSSCHMWMGDSADGNSITFSFVQEAADSSTLWQQGGASVGAVESSGSPAQTGTATTPPLGTTNTASSAAPTTPQTTSQPQSSFLTSVTSSASIQTSSISSTTAGSPVAASAEAPSPTSSTSTSNSPSNLSPLEAGGVAVASIVALVLLCLLSFMAYRRVRMALRNSNGGRSGGGGKGPMVEALPIPPKSIGVGLAGAGSTAAAFAPGHRCGYGEGCASHNEKCLYPHMPQYPGHAYYGHDKYPHNEGEFALVKTYHEKEA